jgi:hypothetical protein
MMWTTLTGGTMTAAVLEYKPTLSHGWFLVAIFVASYPLWHSELPFTASVITETTVSQQVIEPAVANFAILRDLSVPVVADPAGACAGQH